MIEIAPAALADHVPVLLDGFRRFIRREPLGTLFVIAPWNYPYLSAVNSVIPGLMAGNAVVLKHAAQTLLVGERFQAAFDRRLPSGLFRILVLHHNQTVQSSDRAQVHQVNFTGSVAAGREIETDNQDVHRHELGTAKKNQTGMHTTIPFWPSKSSKGKTMGSPKTSAAVSTPCTPKAMRSH